MIPKVASLRPLYKGSGTRGRGIPKGFLGMFRDDEGRAGDVNIEHQLKKASPNISAREHGLGTPRSVVCSVLRAPLRVFLAGDSLQNWRRVF